ncbi:hypothetical protein LI328DRAFT_138889 [Trichoderma asperelloides]|nr:hypothetical protein LI328DRAFT_138889 [Trichoderma asperelloides]
MKPLLQQVSAHLMLSLACVTSLGQSFHDPYGSSAFSKNNNSNTRLNIRCWKTNSLSHSILNGKHLSVHTAG